MVNWINDTTEQETTSSIDEALSAEVIATAKKVDGHLFALEKIIAGEMVDPSIEKHHAEIQAEIQALIWKIWPDRSYILNDEAMAALNQLKGAINTKTPEIAQQNYENSSVMGKIGLFANTRKLPVAAAIGIGTMRENISDEVGTKHTWVGKAWARIKWVTKWVLVWGLTYLGMHALGAATNLANTLNPKNRAQKAKYEVIQRRRGLTGQG